MKTKHITPTLENSHFLKIEAFYRSKHTNNNNTPIYTQVCSSNANPDGVDRSKALRSSSKSIAHPRRSASTGRGQPAVQYYWDLMGYESSRDKGLTRFTPPSYFGDFFIFIFSDVSTLCELPVDKRIHGPNSYLT